jgi:exopolysaccharide biosynthesis protein
VRFRTVLPLGYDRYGNHGECNDVHRPDSIPGGVSGGPGCYVADWYPGQRVEHMALRFEGAVAAFNGDFFSPTYDHGAIGLVVRNGERLDGLHNDRDDKEVERSSLSISREGDVRIGLVLRSELPHPDQPSRWVPDPQRYYNTIAGLPLLVKNGAPVDLPARCRLEEGWCPDPVLARARTAVGKTGSGVLVVVVVPEQPGITLRRLSHLLVELGATAAINLDGGGSSQLWYEGQNVVFSSRPVALGMLVFARPTDWVEARMISGAQ